MAAKRDSRSKQARQARPPSPQPRYVGLDVAAELERVIDTPLAELVPTDAERAAAEQLSHQALGTPALARLAQVVAFVGRGRPATQAGNLKPADALALAAQLGLDQPLPARVGSIDDLPDTAHAFRWAAAAEFLEWRGTKILPAARAVELDRDPLAAWLKAAVTLLEHGLLDGFRRGWRKAYVEMLDASVGSLLVSMVQAGGTVALPAIEAAAWEEVAVAYDLHADDQAERAHLVRLIRAIVAQLAYMGMVTQAGDRVVLTDLGRIIAVMADISGGLDDDEVDLIDTDALSLLMVCVEDEKMTSEEARAHVEAWVQGRPDQEAAAELCEAMLEDDDPRLWALGLEAIGRLDPAVAVPTVARLCSHAELGALAADWLTRPPGRVRRSRRR